MIKKFFMMTVLLAITVCHSKAQTNLTMSGMTAKAGETVTMSVMTTGAFDAFSFVVKSPEGIKLSKVQRGALIKAQNDDEEYIYSYANADREDGTRYVQCYSASAIATTEPGEVSKLVFEIDPTVTAGKYNVELLETECALGGQMVSTYTSYTATITIEDSKVKTNLTLSDMTAKAGETVTMSVMATGAFDAFSFVVKSPEGIKLSKVQRGALIKAQNDDEEYIYSYANATREDGTRYVQCYSASAIATTEPGEVSKLVFEIDPTVTAGKYDIELLETECALGGQMVSTYTTYTATITVDDATGIDNVSTSWAPHGMVAIYNVAGKMVKQVITDGSRTIEDCLTDQQNGIYLIRTEKGTFKIVK